MCKTFLATEPICKAYCGVYPLSPDLKAFSLSISLSEVRPKSREEGINEETRLHVTRIIWCFAYFLLKSSHEVFEITKLLT